MKRKIFSMFLFATLFIIVLVSTSLNVQAATTASGACGDRVSWKLDNSGTLTISGTGDMWEWVYSWDSYKASIKKVIVKNGVTSVADYAFSKCENLTSVDLADSVKSIGFGAFDWCTSLTSINIPDGVETIDSSTFYNCKKLTSITLSNSLKTIEDNAFQECKSLTSIDIPKSVTYIGNSAFSSCTNLVSINIPDGVTFIGNRTFYDCESLESINIPDGVTSIGNYAFWCCESLTSIDIPDGVTSIGEYAFRACDSLTCIDIPESVTFIGENAFFYCDKLEKVTVYNKDVSYGGSSVFSLCYKLTLYGYEGSTTQTYADNIKKPFVSIIERGSCGDNLSFMLYGDGTLEICGEGDMWNWSSESLPPWYSNRTSVEKVIIKDGVTSVGNAAFYDCMNLASIDIPGGVTYIGESAFILCTSLVSINIPESVTSIGAATFFGCESLVNIDISKSVTSIGESAFFSCSNLVSINIPTSVTYIGGYAFYCCTSLTSIDIPDSVTSISEWAFSDCTSLTSIVIPDSVATISGWAFDGCTKLSTVNYIGTEEEWNKITIGSNNSPLLGANIIFLLEKGCVPFEGAQIRTEGEQGLRYIFKIPKALSENCLEFGSVVMPKKYLGENALEIGLVTTINDKNYSAKKVPAKKIFGEDDEYIYYTVCITKIKESNYSSEYVAVPYVITKKADGFNRTTYGEEQSLTVNEVMSALSE